MKNINKNRFALSFIATLLLCVSFVNAQVTVINSNSNGTYSTLGDAFSAINGTAQTNTNIVIRLTADITEPATATLNAGAWSTLIIYPTVADVILTGDFSGPIINLYGTVKVTIDGRVNHSGTTLSLILRNINTSDGTTSTIRFINSATNNTVNYCHVRGSETDAASGVIFLSTSTGGNGNDNNTISNCDITRATVGGRPVNGIFSSGTSGRDNNNLIVRGNNIHNLLNPSAASNCILLSSFTSAATIDANSFYDTEIFIPTLSYSFNIISIDNSSGINFSITDNYIGGGAAFCSGTWTKNGTANNTFSVIRMNVGTSTASSIQNNTIKNFDWTNSGAANWKVINIIDGNVNIGTTTGNTIGATTGTGSISVTAGGNNMELNCLDISGAGTVNFQNNIIGSITTNNSSTADDASILLINKDNVAGNTNISNNIIGSTTTANSINASCTSTANSQNLRIILLAGPGNNVIHNNTIANIKNSCTGSSSNLDRGIIASNGTNTITNNIVRDFKTSSKNTSFYGIVVWNNPTINTITGNAVYNLSSLSTTDTGNIYGISVTNTNIVSPNTISSNFIYGLSTASADVNIYGLNVNGGINTISNNIISITNNISQVYGVNENGSSTNDINKIYHNTVYIGGTLATGTKRSFALYSSNNTTIRDIRNNIFANMRTNSTGAGIHYAAYYNYATTTNLTNNYNDYYASGTGGILGFYNSGSLTTLVDLQTAIGQDKFSWSANPLFASAGGTTAASYIPSNDELFGKSLAAVTTDYTGTTTRAAIPTIGAYEITLDNNVEVWTGGLYEHAYKSLGTAFNGINIGAHTGAISVKILDNTIETVSAVLNASGSGSASYSNVIVYPTSTGKSVSGNLAAPIIDLNSADNVTIDGRVNATGSSKDLILTNTNTSSSGGVSAIRFINDASNNTVKYCKLKGSQTQPTSGIVFFSAISSTGNNNNLIDNNDITNASDVNRPVTAIYSDVTANGNNTISNNNIFDFFNRSFASLGIYLANSTTVWNITGNSFYETTNFVPAASVEYNVIKTDGASLNGLNISNNYFGGSAPLCAGTPWRKTNAFDNAFKAMYISTSGASVVNSIQENTIKNFNWSNSLNASWMGMYIFAGNVNVGTTTGNTIGSIIGTGSINYTATTSGANVYGIYSSNGGAVNCSNNLIGSIYSNNTSANNANIYGIYTSDTSGAFTASNNTVGSISWPNSINAASTSTDVAQIVCGIYNNNPNSIAISGNTISNLTNGTTSATTTIEGRVVGIQSTVGVNTVTNNIVRNLSIANANNSATNTASVIGIAHTSSIHTATLSENTIYNLTNTYTSFTGNIYGLYFSNGDVGNIVSNNTIYSLSTLATTASNVTGLYLNTSVTTNTVSGNKIYNLSTPNTAAATASNVIGLSVSAGAATLPQNYVSENFIYDLSTGVAATTASIYGIKAISGGTRYFNNIITIGNNYASTIYGFYDTGSTSQTIYLFHNTIYINGQPTTGTNTSYNVYSAANTNLRYYRNNILFNSRSNNGASGAHYCMYFVSTGGSHTVSNNDYFVNGTGGVLGYYGSNKTSLPIVTGQDSGSIIYNPGFTNAGGTLAADYIPSYFKLKGGLGTAIGNDYSGTLRPVTPNPPTMGAYEITLSSNVDLFENAVFKQSYTTLKASFDAINAGTYKGILVLQVNANTTETTSAVLNASGSGNASYTSINIYPTVTGLSVTGNFDIPLIDLNGADNVTIDGRVNATGSTKDLTITNNSIATTTGTTTIRFINDASSNTVNYCNIKGSTLDINGGIIFFSNTSATTGNDNNTITENNITNSADLNRPLCGIFSFGNETSKSNSGNTISNNNIYNIFNRSTNSGTSGIHINRYNSDWTITGNSFYETTTVVPSGSGGYTGIKLDNTGTGFVISNNFIGGSAPLASGSAFTKTSNNNNIFGGIIIINSSCSVQNNVIKNITWSNSANAIWEGINIRNASVDIGNLTGNTIGAPNTGVITVTNNTSGGTVYGIKFDDNSHTINCQNNVIQSIVTANAAPYETNFIGISTISEGAYFISNNTIGSTTLANSIHATSAASRSGNHQNVYGIYCAGNGINNVSNNIISNLTNGTTNSNEGTMGQVMGIYAGTGINTINNNTITNLTISNVNNISSGTPSVSGIFVSRSTSNPNTLNGNTIAYLSNTNASFAGVVEGISFAGGTSVAENSIAGNFIHDLTVNSATSGASFYGIEISQGNTLLSNNIISLGGNADTKIYGIYETGSVSQISNMYFNSIYISGTPTTGALNSYALYSNATTNTRNYRNNILFNARSNNGATGKHYAAYFNYGSASFLTLNYNDYYTPGTGGTLAYYNGADISNLSALQTAIGQDAKSKSVNPIFAAAGGTHATDYLPSYIRLKGVGGTGITTDYAGVTRFTTQPAMGALEYGAETFSKELLVKVYLQGLWNNANNNMNTCKIVGGITQKFSGTVVDTVFLELHDPSNYATIVHKVCGLELHQDGTINSTGLDYIDIPETYSGNYYVTIRTRNHLETTSATGVSFSPDAPVYDFTTAATQAYGSNMKQLATGIYGFYAGDVTQDGLIDPLTDFALVKSAINSYAAGYHVCDLNGDGLIDPLTDFATVKAQINAYIKAILP